MAIALVILLALMFSYILSRRIAKPIKAIVEATKNYSHGDYTGRVITRQKDEIGALAGNINEMADFIEASEEVRKNFISDVSHELRTPMTTISGFVGGILDGTITGDKEREYLSIVLDETKRLSRLTGQLLDISRLEGTALSKHRFDINEAVRLCVINFENLIREKNLNVKVDFDDEQCLVYADRDAIQRVLTNLIDNAIKFTDPFGEITVKTEDKSTDIRISVHNTGIGITKDELRNIWDRFYKADKSRSRNRYGTGLGLFIAKNIVNLHEKDITCESIPGEYAEFTFTLDKLR